MARQLLLWKLIPKLVLIMALQLQRPLHHLQGTDLWLRLFRTGER